MKAFDNCDRRRDGSCIQFGGKCNSETIINIEDEDWRKTCWRMCKENVYYMQCPDCRSRLFFDNQVTNSFGLKDIFYCPKCDKEVLRENALVLAETLGKMMKKSEDFLREADKINFLPGPRQLDKINHHRYEVIRLSGMILRLARGEKIHMNRNLTGLVE